MTAQVGGEVLASTLGSQFDQLGIILIAISVMGIVQTDKAYGMLAFIMTRPVSPISYISGKISSNYLVSGLQYSVSFFIQITCSRKYPLRKCSQH